VPWLIFSIVSDFLFSSVVTLFSAKMTRDAYFGSRPPALSDESAMVPARATRASISVLAASVPTRLSYILIVVFIDWCVKLS
jgi:hypothetical protein